MTNNSTEERFADAYFGSCPVCGGNDGYINIGRSHWFRCDEHRAAWGFGSNLFSSWKEQTREEQKRLYDEIGMSEYRIVEPLSEDENRPENLFAEESIKSLPRLGAFDDGEGKKIDFEFEVIGCRKKA
jgi:hypothetical protein